LGRQLYPELDLWQTAKPFLESWFKERFSPKTKISDFIKQLPDLAQQFPEVPTFNLQSIRQCSTRRKTE
jgi:ubiquinone biosynthesis protein